MNQLDHSCNCFLKYYQKTQQSQHYHTQLSIYLSKLTKVANDYIVARKLTQDALINKLCPKKPEPSDPEKIHIPVFAKSFMDSVKSKKKVEVKEEPKETLQIIVDELELPEEGKASQVRTSIDPNTIKVMSSVATDNSSFVSEIIPKIPEKVEDPSSLILLGYKGATVCTHSGTEFHYVPKQELK